LSASKNPGKNVQKLHAHYCAVVQQTQKILYATDTIHEMQSINMKLSIFNTEMSKYSVNPVTAQLQRFTWF